MMHTVYTSTCKYKHLHMSSCKSTQRTNVLLLDLVHQKECAIVSGAARSSYFPSQARFHYLSLYKAF